MERGGTSAVGGGEGWRGGGRMFGSGGGGGSNIHGRCLLFSAHGHSDGTTFRRKEAFDKQQVTSYPHRQSHLAFAYVKEATTIVYTFVGERGGE